MKERRMQPRDDLDAIRGILSVIAVVTGAVAVAQGIIWLAGKLQ